HTRFSRDWSSDVCSSDLAHVAVAERYAALAQTDPVNAQAWSTCSAVAFKRAMGEDGEFAQYARQASQMLQLVMTSPANPCQDAKIGRASCRERGRVAVDA